MAAKDLDGGVVKKQELYDITTCCICTEVYTDPKALPCIHTFCMKCLQETGLTTKKGPGDEMPCPICRRLFKIPSEGVRGLPKNFFIENLIQVANISDQSASSRSVCDSCRDENKEETGKEIPAADTYCVDCNQKFCEECCRQHRKLKLTKHHRLIPLTEHESGQNVMTDLAPSICELHEHKVLDVYCADCKTVVCAMCFIDEHKNHEGSDVKKFVDGFRKQIESSVEAINECRTEAETKKGELLKVKEDIQKRVGKLECDVEKRKDELKQFTDKHATSLLQNLLSIRQSKLKEIQMTTDDIDTYLSCLETYNFYCQNIIAKGSATDICRAFSDLSVRAMELQHQCKPTTEREIQSFNFRFRKSELEQFLEEICDNLIGEIEEEGDLTTRKRSKQSLLAEKSKEIELLQKQNKSEKESLSFANEQLRSNMDKEVQANKALTEELGKDKDNYKEHIKKLERVIDNNKITNSTLQGNIDKLKQELDARNMTNNTLQTNNDKLKQELDKEKIANNTLRANNDKLKQEMDAKNATNNSCQAHNDKLKQELEKEKNSQRLSTNRLVQEVNAYKLTIERLENNVEKLNQELEKTKTDKLRYRSNPVLVQRIRTKAAEEERKAIVALTILDKELYIVNGESSEVEVYNSNNYCFRRRWNLKELIHPWDIGSCNKNKCLYIFDFRGFDQSKEMLIFNANGKLIKNWSTGDDYGRLSVTDDSNVILSVYKKNKLNEYSPDGQLIREIYLSAQAGFNHPWHAIKLTNGHFVISHGYHDDELHRVCIVGADGELKKSFGGKLGSTIGQMNVPVYLSVDGNGFVMVADLENGHVLLLDSDLEFQSNILSKGGKHELRFPSKILLDESNGRMFVVDNAWDFNKLIFGDGQIFIFNLK